MPAPAAEPEAGGEPAAEPPGPARQGRLEDIKKVLTDIWALQLSGLGTCLTSNTWAIMVAGQKIALGRGYVGRVLTLHVAETTRRHRGSTATSAPSPGPPPSRSAASRASACPAHDLSVVVAGTGLAHQLA